MVNKTENILVLSMFYYPDNRVGAKRFGNLVKIFCENQINTHVLTIKKNQIPIIDETLIPEGVVHRVPMIPKYPMDKSHLINRLISRLWEKIFCIIEPFSGWIIPAILKSLKVVKKNDITIIIATGPPFSTFVVGIFVKLFTGAKLILDYRDPWTTYKNNSYPIIFGSHINKTLEKIANNLSDCNIFCSNKMRQSYITKFKTEKIDKQITLTNGYKELNANKIYDRNKSNKKVMIYAGNMYGGRSLSLIAKVLFDLKNKNIINVDNFIFEIYGKILSKDEMLISKYKLSPIIKVYNAIPYNEVIKKMQLADILFLPSGEEVAYAIPFKFFDYLMAKRPILAIAPKNSEIKEILKEIKHGFFCEIADFKNIEKTIVKLMTYTNKENDFVFQKYSWKKISHRYIEIIDKI